MTHDIELAGEAVTLCPQRALYWPRERTLFIADPHFGKAATFRARGVFVPHGTTKDNLARLDLLIATWRPRRIIFLGDLFHARPAQEAATQDALARWRAQHLGLQLSLVAGNHDRHAGPPRSALQIEHLDASYQIGPFVLRHEPQPELDSPHYVLAGHVHPGFRLLGRGHERARVPCFWFGQKVGVLPAFGAFTGALNVTAGIGERIFLAGPDQVRAIPSRARLD